MCFRAVSKAVVVLSRFGFRAKLEGIASVCIQQELFSLYHVRKVTLQAQRTLTLEPQKKDILNNHNIVETLQSSFFSALLANILRHKDTRTKNTSACNRVGPRISHPKTSKFSWYATLYISSAQITQSSFLKSPRVLGCCSPTLTGKPHRV